MKKPATSTKTQTPANDREALRAWRANLPLADRCMDEINAASARLCVDPEEVLSALVRSHLTEVESLIRKQNVEIESCSLGSVARLNPPGEPVHLPFPGVAGLLEIDERTLLEFIAYAVHRNGELIRKAGTALPEFGLRLELAEMLAASEFIVAQSGYATKLEDKDVPMCHCLERWMPPTNTK